MEKLMDREVAWRIFAHEFNMSNIYISEGEERAPNYIITPTGVKCNRLFIIGVVTEVENIGRDNNLWRARVADPTGVFTMYAGQYQPEAAIFLSEMQVPAYVALSGKARKYEPENGAVYLSVRPEEINASDERQRDRWVLETAERTLDRILIIEDALHSGLSGNELREYLAKKLANPSLAGGVELAIQHYKKLDKIMLELRKVILDAVSAVDGERPKIETTEHIATESNLHEKNTEKTKQGEHISGAETEGTEKTTETKTTEIKKEQPDPKETLAAIIDQLDTGKGTTFSKVIETAQKAGIQIEIIESSIKELMDEGRCYEPRIGILRKV